MGRRSDHSREELRSLMLEEGRRLMGEVGFHRFSARKVAERVGYSVGTLYNVFETLDALVMAINTRTFTAWTAFMSEALDRAGRRDRIAVLVQAYFDFAQANPNLWMAIFDHRLPPGMVMPEDERAERAKLGAIAEAEISRALDRPIDDRIVVLARSLVATVHGHCVLALGGSLAEMGERRPVARALDRVRDSLRVAARGA
ncbi:MAG TPA: TetR/AcrR family transcriptional regulator [Caulobacteraceae bacterium]|jgi:AcrR family transcriptional regulator|nr:TetR/AcrR family transcriptional regulator [Caulobacteraceae bacterium]